MSTSKRHRNQAAPTSGTTSARARPVQAPKLRPAKRRRRGLAGLLATVLLVAVAAVAGLLLARNSSTRNLSIGGQKIALPSQAAASANASLRSLGSAPPFSMRTLGGSTFALQPGRGPVVLSFIAGWCSSCLQEAAADGQVIRTFRKQGVRVLAIDADPSDSLAQLRKFIGAAGNPPIQWAWDRTSEVTLAYKVRALDTTVIIDRQGRMVYRDEYPTDYATLASVLKKLA